MSESQIIHVLIVDDEPGARRRLERLLEDEVDIELVGHAGTGRKAVSMIEEKKPDLVFLDVQMPNMSGIEVVQHIGPRDMPAVVFVTAYDQYAVKAFELAATDYLLKPFDDDRFVQTLERARQALQINAGTAISDRLEALLESYQKNQASSEAPTYIERIAVEVKGQIRVVPIENIDYITASGNYVDLFVGEEKLLVREQMHKLEDKLPPKQFFRIHRSSIVRLGEIERLVVNPGGDYAVLLRNRKLLKVSRGRWRELMLRLGLNLPAGEESPG